VSGAPKAFLFDIGNVLLRLKTDDFLARLEAGHSGLDTGAFLADLRDRAGAHDAYERGLISGREFHAILSKRWNLIWDYDVWLKNWNDYFLPNPPMEVLLAKLAGLGGFRFFALSNTNAEHLAHVRRLYRLFDGFEAVFASHELGLRKPEPDIFKAAIAKIGLEPEAILFLDDVADYAQAARDLGLRAFHYHFNDLELKAYLKENGLDLPVWETRPGARGC
jgi:putative hydrolase of the HAD superfamily